MAKERSVDQLVCHGVPPAPVYKGARGKEAGPRRGRAKCGVHLPCWSRRRGKEGERRKEKGAAPLVQFGPEGAACLLPFGLSPLFPYGPLRPNTSPGGSGNPPALRFNPKLLRNTSGVQI